MGDNKLDFVTKDDLFQFKQDLKMELNVAVHQEIEKNNETLMAKLMDKIEEDLFKPLRIRFEYIGSLVTLQDTNKKWISKSIKEYLGIRVKAESPYEYNSIMDAYKAKLRINTGKTITRLEDIPQTIENIKLLDEVCKFMYPDKLRQGKLFKNRVNK